MNENLLMMNKFSFFFSLYFFTTQINSQILESPSKALNSKYLMKTKSDGLNISFLFEFDTEILNDAKINSLDGIKTKIRKFNGKIEFETILKYTSLIYNLNYVKILIDRTKIITNDSLINNHIEVSYDDKNHLNKISFRLNQSGYYILCYYFINSVNDNLSFHLNEMCVDIMVENNSDIIPEKKYVYYRPLFIPIMYSLCALMLFPVVIWKNILAKSKKSKKKKLQEKDRNGLNFTENSILTTSNSSPENLRCITNVENEFEFYNLVCVDRKISTDTQINQQILEPDHILNSKPWLLNDTPLVDTKVSYTDFLIKIPTITLNSTLINDQDDDKKIKLKKKKKIFKFREKLRETTPAKVIECKNQVSARNEIHKNKTNFNYFLFETNV